MPLSRTRTKHPAVSTGADMQAANMKGAYPPRPQDGRQCGVDFLTKARQDGCDLKRIDAALHPASQGSDCMLPLLP